MHKIIDEIQDVLQVSGGLFVFITIACLINHHQASKRQGRNFMERYHNEPNNRDAILNEETAQYGELAKKTVHFIWLGGCYCLAMLALGIMLAVIRSLIYSV